MNRSELPLVTLDGRHTGALLAHPCPCPNPTCQSLGEHLWDSTRNMTPGPRAQTFEPRINSTPTTGDRDDRPDPTGTLHTDYHRLLVAYQHSARDLQRFVDTHRPDRHTPTIVPVTDADWCRNHLDGIGKCEPRYRGDLCRWCYEVAATHGTIPDPQYMRARHERGRSTPAMEAGFLERTRATRPKKRKKAG